MGKIIILNGCGKQCRRKPVSAKAHKVKIRWHFGPQTFVEGKMARITNEEVVPVSVNPLTGKGNPAPIDGVLVWASSDESVATVVADVTDSKKALVTAVAPGVAQITVQGDADMDPGEERFISGSGAVEVVAAEAQTLEIVFGTPQ